MVRLHVSPSSATYFVLYLVIDIRPKGLLPSRQTRARVFPSSPRPFDLPPRMTLETDGVMASKNAAVCSIPTFFSACAHSLDMCCVLDKVLWVFVLFERDSCRWSHALFP